MTTVKVHAEIDADGKLRVEVPLGLPAGRAEVLVVVQPEGTNGRGKVFGGTGSARSDLFTAKSDQDIDVDAALNEMNEPWKSKFAGLS